MPYLHIQTSQTLGEPQQTVLLQDASRTVAELLGKPERYVMVALSAGIPMLFAADSAPSAYLELKSIGLPESRTAELSAALCRLLESQLHIPPERIYIEFSNAARNLWGWNSATF